MSLITLKTIFLITVISFLSVILTIIFFPDSVHSGIPPGDSGEFLAIAAFGGGGGDSTLSGGALRSSNSKANSQEASSSSSASPQLLAHQPGYGLYTLFLSRLWVPYIARPILMPLLQIIYTMKKKNTFSFNFGVVNNNKQQTDQNNDDTDNNDDENDEHDHFLSSIIQATDEYLSVGVPTKAMELMSIIHSALFETPDETDICLRKINGLVSGYYSQQHHHFIGSKNTNSNKPTQEILKSSSFPSSISSCDILFKSLHASSIFFSAIGACFLVLAGIEIVTQLTTTSSTTMRIIDKKNNDNNVEGDNGNHQTTLISTDEPSVIETAPFVVTVTICTSLFVILYLEYREGEPSRRYATEVEVFAMNQALISFGCYCLTKFTFLSEALLSSSSSPLYYCDYRGILMMSGLCLGLAFGHQHSILFVCAPTIVFCFLMIFRITTVFGNHRKNTIPNIVIKTVLLPVLGFVFGALPSVLHVHFTLISSPTQQGFVFGQQQQPQQQDDYHDHISESFRNTLHFLMRSYYGTFQMMSSTTTTNDDEPQEISILDSSFAEAILQHVAWLWGNYQQLLTVAFVVSLIACVLFQVKPTRSAAPIGRILFVSVCNLCFSIVGFAWFSSSSSSSSPTLVHFHVYERFWLQSVPILTFIVIVCLSSIVATVFMCLHNNIFWRRILVVVVTAVVLAVVITTTSSRSGSGGNNLNLHSSSSSSSSHSSSLLMFASSLVRSALSSPTTKPQDNTMTTISFLITDGDITFAPLLTLYALSDQFPIVNNMKEKKEEKDNHQFLVMMDASLSTNSWYRKQHIVGSQLKKHLMSIDSSMSFEHTRNRILNQVSEALDQAFSSPSSPVNTLDHHQFDLLHLVNVLLLHHLRGGTTPIRFEIITLVSAKVLPQLPKVASLFRDMKSSSSSLDCSIESLPGALHRISCNNNPTRETIPKQDEDEDDEDNQDEVLMHNEVNDKNDQMATMHRLLNPIVKYLQETLEDEYDLDDVENGEEEEISGILKNNKMKTLTKRKLKDSNHLMLLLDSLLRLYLGVDYYDSNLAGAMLVDKKNNNGRSSSSSWCHTAYRNAKVSLDAFERVRSTKQKLAAAASSSSSSSSSSLPLLFQSYVSFFRKIGFSSTSSSSTSLSSAWDTDLNKLCAIGIQNSFQKLVLDVLEYSNNDDERVVMMNNNKRSLHLALSLLKLVIVEELVESKEGFYQNFISRTRRDEEKTYKTTSSYSPLWILTSAEVKEITESFRQRIVAPALKDLEKMIVVALHGNDENAGIASSSSVRQTEKKNNKKKKDFGSW